MTTNPIQPVQEVQPAQPSESIKPMQSETRNITLSEGSAKVLYKKYKALFIPYLVLLLTFVAFYFIEYPQIQQLPTLTSQVSQISLTNNQLRENEKVLSSINDKNYSEYLATVSAVLPQQKDYTGVIQAIAGAANASNTTLSDYTFQVGDLATNSARLATQNSLSVSLLLTNGAFDTQHFATKLLQSIPLSEISDLSVNNVSATLDTSFFYQPYTQAGYNPKTPIFLLSNNDINTINVFKKWKDAQETNAATASALITNPSVTPIPGAYLNGGSLSPTPTSTTTNQSSSIPPAILGSLGKCSTSSATSSPFCVCYNNYLQTNYTQTQLDTFITDYGGTNTTPQAYLNAANVCQNQPL